MTEINEILRQRLIDAGVDVEMSLSLLERVNRGDFDHLQPVKMDTLPGINGHDIIDASSRLSLEIEAGQLREALGNAGLNAEALLQTCSIETPADAGEEVLLDHSQLELLGLALVPYTAYGVLNGGSATSYCDTKKNRGLNADIFDALTDEFSSIAEDARKKPKGLTPAFVHPDGSPGFSFLELKMRSLLLNAFAYKQTFGAIPGKTLPAAPMFQMSSVFTREELLDSYKEFRNSPLLKELIEHTGIDITQVKDAMQPLLSAFSHSSDGSPRTIFDKAYGKENTPVAIPGGHGQNFQVLSNIYRELYSAGKRFAYIGNVDNLGFTIQPASLAYFALSGRPAAFEFSFKTPVDVKGGVLVREADGTLTCGDIGPAVAPEALAEAEQSGTPILFNAATGLFRLDYLVEHLESIISRLPVRLSDQDKDPGKYSQAEQVTWEVIGMLDGPLIFGINKYKRFLAAKLLLETMLTSGRMPEQLKECQDSKIRSLKQEADRLNSGLHELLVDVYGMTLENGRYRPLGLEELLKNGTD
ncbi:UTP--glucose-1-phosphate uridylyltransferase [Spirochaeta dissipatitropha]